MRLDRVPSVPGVPGNGLGLRSESKGRLERVPSTGAVLGRPLRSPCDAGSLSGLGRLDFGEAKVKELPGLAAGGAGLFFPRRLEPLERRRPAEDPPERRRRPLGAAASTLLASPSWAGSRPASRAGLADSRPVSRGDEDDADDFRAEMRANIKGRSKAATASGLGSPLDVGFGSPPRRRIGMAAGRRQIAETAAAEAAGAAWDADSPAPSSDSQPSPELGWRHTEERRRLMACEKEAAGDAALLQAKTVARARLSACLEDLIFFLEMHNLTGAYALAFAANGVEDLSQLLCTEGEELEKLIAGCAMDAMDEILLRDALRSTRP